MGARASAGKRKAGDTAAPSSGGGAGATAEATAAAAAAAAAAAVAEPSYIFSRTRQRDDRCGEYCIRVTRSL